MQKIIDFMGDDSVWATMVPGVVIQRRSPSRHAPQRPTAYFVDSHWKARKAGDTNVFDPWDHYQKPGTHKFCQTFAMMYLLDVLPTPVYDYKMYDICARKFIRSVLENLPDNHPAFMWDSRKTLSKTSIGVRTHSCKSWSPARLRCASASGNNSSSWICTLDKSIFLRNPYPPQA